MSEQTPESQIPKMTLDMSQVPAEIRSYVTGQYYTFGDRRMNLMPQDNNVLGVQFIKPASEEDKLNYPDRPYESGDIVWREGDKMNFLLGLQAEALLALIHFSGLLAIDHDQLEPDLMAGWLVCDDTPEEITNTPTSIHGQDEPISDNADTPAEG